MKKREAYQLLDLPETATKEEVKKAFKSKAKLMHPDIDKSPGAEDRFKKINEAQQAIDNNTFDDNPAPFGMPFSGGFSISDLGDLFGNFGFSRKTKYKAHAAAPRDIYINQTITFKEAVIGCKKDLTYTCDIMCEKCRGEGEKLIDNGCKTCGGKGRVFHQQGMMFIERSCNECKGKINYEPCSHCSSNGKLSSERTISVSIDPGILDGSVRRLAGIGNFSPTHGHSHVFLSVKVIPEKGLFVDNNDVITHLQISLLEALIGCKKEVNTIDGPKDIDVPAVSKNKDEVILPKLGVARQGNERVIVDVIYPQHLDKLIEALKEEK